MSSTPGTMRATPYYCPYCGEQDLRPTATERTWHCRTCERVWRLEFHRIGNPDATPAPPVADPASIVTIEEE